MKIFAIADLHLSLSVPEKTMEVFSKNWLDYHNKIKQNWEKEVSKNDLVLIAGDICWAMHLKDALIDLNWIDALPGKKVIIKGNHDYWWPSSAKLANSLPPSISFIHNSALDFDNIAIGGTKFFDSFEYNFSNYIDFVKNPLENDIEAKIQKDLQKKLFTRELIRLETSLKLLNKNAKIKIAMTHYPPIGADLKESIASRILEKYNIDICIFGHLHNLNKQNLFGEKNNIKYILTSADYIDFKPVLIKEIHPGHH